MLLKDLYKKYGQPVAAKVKSSVNNQVDNFRVGAKAIGNTRITNPTINRMVKSPVNELPKVANDRFFGGLARESMNVASAVTRPFNQGASEKIQLTKKRILPEVKVTNNWGKAGEYQGNIQKEGTKIVATLPLGINQVKALNAAKPATKLLAYGGIRGAENAAYGAVQRAGETGNAGTGKDVIKDFAIGAGTNALLSPKLTTQAYREVRDNVKEINRVKGIVEPVNQVAYELSRTANPKTVAKILDDFGMIYTGLAKKNLVRELAQEQDPDKIFKRIMRDADPVGNVKVNYYKPGTQPGFAKNPFVPEKKNLIKDLEGAGIKPKATTVAQETIPQNTKIRSSQQLSPEQQTGVLSNYQEVSSFDSTIPQNQQIVNDTSNIMNGGQIRERGFVTSVKTGDKTPQQVKDMVNGTYVVKSDSERIAHARNLIQSDPQVAEQMALNPRNDTDITIGNQLLDNYLATGQFDKASQLTDKMAQSGTELGRAVHAFSDYDKTTPAGAVKFAQKTINAFNRENPGKKIALTNENIQNLMDRAHSIQKMAQGRERNIASKQLMDEVNNLIPSTIADKAVTVWKAGLLTSLRTTERNLLGNSLHAVAEVMKDPFAVLNDSLLSLKTGQRTKTLTMKGAVSGAKKGLQSAKDIYTTGYDPEQMIEKFDVKHITWGNNPVEQGLKKYTDLVFRNMGAQDKPFYHASFARSLYDQAGAEAINAGKRGSKEFIESLVQNPTEKMKLNATKDAQIAVFQNKNAASKVSSAIKAELKKDPTGILGAVGEIVMPFTGVPSSIAGQLLSYSPIGLMKGLADNVNILANKVTPEMIPDLQRQASQEVGRGVIGSGILAIGAYLTSKGLMTGQPKDANEAKQWELEGKQANSVMVNGRWQSINSIGPEALVALAGSKMAMGEGAGKTAASIGKDFTNQTFLSGVQQPLNAISDPARYGGTYVKNQAASVIPNIVKDVAKSGDKTQRETNGSSDQMKAGLPGLRNTLLPKRDVLGKELPNEQSGVKAFIDLFNSKTPSKDSTIKELSRLYSIDQSATPSKLSANQTVYGQKLKLTPEQLDAFEGSTGEQVKKALDEILNTSGYKNADDEMKKKIIDGVVSDVRDSGKKGLNINTNSLAEKYKSQLQKDQFSNSGKNFQIIDGMVYRKNKDGSTATPISEDEYNSKLYDAQLTSLQNSNDYTSWFDTAKKQYSALTNQMNDPNVDELDKITIQNKLNTLVTSAAKFKSYGGFKKAKVVKAKVSTAKIKAMKAPKAVKFKSPKKLKIRKPKKAKIKKIT